MKQILHLTCLVVEWILLGALALALVGMGLFAGMTLGAMLGVSEISSALVTLLVLTVTSAALLVVLRSCDNQ